MTERVDRPTDASELRRLRHRVYQLERIIRNLERVAPDRVLKKSFSQAIIEVQTSGRWYPHRKCLLYEASISVDDAVDSGTLTVAVNVNGALVDSQDITSVTAMPVSLLLTAYLDRDTDYATVEVTSTGTGAAALHVELRAVLVP